MQIARPRTLLAGLALSLGAAAAVHGALRPRPLQDGPLVVIPFTPSAVRVLGTVESAAFVHAPHDGGEVVLERLVVSVGEDVLHDEPLDITLVGDPRFHEVNALVERLPHEVSGAHREERWFAAPDAPEIPGARALDLRLELGERLEVLRNEYAAAGRAPFVQLDFPLHTDQVFFADEPAGTEREVRVAVQFLQPSGRRVTQTVSRQLVRLAAPLGTPASLAGAGYTVHAGDLHVHSCHGEAVNACAPSGDCGAESFQTSGSFTYAQLRTQYEALGYSWFTATDHSYCINSSSEYAVIQSECAALTDASFLVMPDIELSSDEVGPQVGSDLGDLVCLGFTSSNHMGAHGLSQRIAGGDQGFQGFCDGLFSDALDDFQSNIARVRAQDGYAIAHHPASGSFGWNSFAATQGLEADGLHGVEIWNDATTSGQGGNVGQWVDWLLAGRLLYAYSGSDTHDTAFVFGANHVLLDGPFTVANVESALKQGRSYISNEHVLVLEARVGAADLPMGTIHPLPPGTPAAPYTARVHYDFGADTGTIQVFTGRAGDSGEQLVCTSGPLTGQGVYECATTLSPSGRSWVRAYSESGSKTAYTNPVFFVGTPDDPGTYCTAKVHSGGCGASIAASGFASVSNPVPFTVTAGGVLNNRPGLLFHGPAPQFGVFAGGTLCVAAPITRTAPQGSGGSASGTDCSGGFSIDFNALIQGGGAPGVTAGSAVYAQWWFRDPADATGSATSDALYFTVGP
jgi:hypothetical protein